MKNHKKKSSTFLGSVVAFLLTTHTTHNTQQPSPSSCRLVGSSKPQLLHRLGSLATAFHRLVRLGPWIGAYCVQTDEETQLHRTTCLRCTTTSFRCIATRRILHPKRPLHDASDVARCRPRREQVLEPPRARRGRLPSSPISSTYHIEAETTRSLSINTALRGDVV
jgi:hypothetical protein